MFVDKAEKQISIAVGPVLVEDKIEVIARLMVVTPLDHKRGEEQAHIEVHLSTLTLNCLI